MAAPTRRAAGTARRGTHRELPHTADAGFTAAASELPALFREAATALSEISAEIAPGVAASIWQAVELEADDLPALAYAWLNELIALRDIHHGAVLATSLVQVDGPSNDDAGRTWSLRGRVGLRPYVEGGVRVLQEPKSATYHGLVLKRSDGCWTLRAYLDL
ncbi:MAG: archease [Chloroflexota bacterium]